MAFLFTKGIVLEQHKEPALSQTIGELLTEPRRMLPDGVAFPADLESVTPEQVVEAAERAAIVDERDGKPLYRKLQRAIRKKVALVVGDAVDDEPYVSSQVGVVINFPHEVAAGLRYCAHAVGAGKQYIAVYKALTDLVTRIPRSVDHLQVVRIMGVYPAELRLSEQFEKEGPALVVGCCAMVQLCRTIRDRLCHTTSFITVAGNCLAGSVNLEVTTGVSVRQVLDHCGLVKTPSTVVLGGPMTGRTVQDLEAETVTPTTRAVLAIWENKRDRYYSCIGCGRCIQVCPRGLNPYLIVQRYMRHIPEGLGPQGYLDARYCIGCGTCSYICPAKLEVSKMVQAARSVAVPSGTGGEAEDETE